MKMRSPARVDRGRDQVVRSKSVTESECQLAVSREQRQMPGGRTVPGRAVPHEQMRSRLRLAPLRPAVVRPPTPQHQRQRRVLAGVGCVDVGAGFDQQLHRLSLPTRRHSCYMFRTIEIGQMRRQCDSPVNSGEAQTLNAEV